LELNNEKKRNLRYSVEQARNIIFANIKKSTINKKRHAFYNFKGGTGKTSICYQVSSHIALLGYKVLVIDADPQGHLSTSCGLYSDENHFTLYE
jgi:chromosome partitioning protein